LVLEPTHLAAGSVIAGDYRVLRALASGGMGSVYVVEQLSTGRERALKVLHAQLSQLDTMRRRFEQEARVGAKIKSEHVVEVIAAGVDGESGFPWLVMELLEGEDLSAFLARRGALGQRETATIVAELCHALGAAHRAGIVHRDLKPENVFLAASRRLGGSFVVKVLDFGIAKIVAEAQTGSTDAVGTPLYMAPEQTAAGQRVGPAADVWALGLLVFRMLTGRSYWKGGNAEGSSAVAVLREVVLEPLPSATERARELGAEAALPDGFDDWFARAVAREPKQRFADASEASRALQGILGGDNSADALAATQAVGDDLAHAPTLALGASQSELARGLTPAAMSRTEDVPEVPEGVVPRRTRWPLVVALGVSVAGAGTWWMLHRDAPSVSAKNHLLGATARSSQSAADAGGASAARGPLLHVCEKTDPPAKGSENCKEPSYAWCNTDEHFVACCAKSLVPSGTSGACVCAPGGAVGKEAIAAGCSKADGPQGLPPEVVKKVIETSFPAARSCYQDRLAANQVLKGRLMLTFQVTPWGDVFSARIRESSLPDPDAQECVLDVIRRLRFPPVRGGGVLAVTYPIEFKLE
jgi:TonB family protein